jgi:signal transduction histidine kinase
VTEDEATHVRKLAHDLRTPLHAISIGTSLLVGDHPTPEQTDVYRRVEAAIDRMSALLEQLDKLTTR